METTVPSQQGELTFARDVNDPLGVTWTLTGPLGAITFGPMGIDIHSPKPLHQGHKPLAINCPVLHGRCYSDGSSLAGQKLRDRWERAGHDDSVIRAELERWYADFPARVAEVCGSAMAATLDGIRHSGTCRLEAGHDGNHQATMYPEGGAR